MGGGVFLMGVGVRIPFGRVAKNKNIANMNINTNANTSTAKAWLGRLQRHSSCLVTDAITADGCWAGPRLPVGHTARRYWSRAGLPKHGQN